MSKHIFITGGVVSSLGKGLTSASIGMLLEGRGLKVAMQKLDPYINVDPGTMSPYQHGEVYVTDDGTETDLDLGHYERYTEAVLTKHCNYTTGKIYNSVIEKERKGDYLGATVQVIPHITDEIKAAIDSLCSDDVDVILTEIGGTVGDIESLPFLEAIRQYRLDKGQENVMYIHLTLLPHLRASGELKTKPTQQSVGKLREIGIQPDVLICRTELPMTEDIVKKISLFCNVEAKAVIEEQDVAYSIYEVPVILHDQHLDEFIVKRLGLKAVEQDLKPWLKMLETVRNPKGEVEIGVVGKYIELHDAYKSVYEALSHGGHGHGYTVKFRKVAAEEVEKVGAKNVLAGVHGLLVPGGFGGRGVEGMVQAIQYARENKIPFFGICLGLQCAAIEIARNLLGLENADSTEFDPATPHPVISLLEEQKGVTHKGGTMRLGAYPCELTSGTLAHRAYGRDQISERHRHRFEFNNKYRDAFLKGGVTLSGLYKDKDLVEILEIAEHPWFLGVQFHPEFQSKPIAAHPLFSSFIGAAGNHAGLGNKKGSGTTKMLA